jgi:hypothetical protein
MDGRRTMTGTERRHVMQTPVALALAWAAAAALGADAPETVRVFDGGAQMSAATWECTSGHQIRKQRITLESSARKYTLLISGCQDPSHEGKHPVSEGNFGMPDPVSANWYWGGFLRVFVNDVDATICDVKDLRVIESGSRGAFQTIWSHPDAEVGLRMLMLPGGNHLLSQLVWKPTGAAPITSIRVELTCYPSFFTAARNRVGERHCGTPRIDQTEPTTLELQPAEDTFLYYYDAVFDMAKGEGDGPCAALVAPEGVQGGQVTIGGYAVQTRLDLKPEAGEARLAFYDFSGRTNAQAEDYLRTQADADLAELQRTDFRPATARAVDVAALKAEALQLVADAAEDGQTFQPRVQELLAALDDLQTKAQAGDWVAEADLSTRIADSADLFWKLRAFAALNRP